MDSRECLPSPPALDELIEAGPVALFLDFDGTLVELAATPDSILPAAYLSNGLRALSQRLDHRLAIVSGRALSDIEKHIGPLPVAGAGSHGADIRAADGRKLGKPPEKFPGAIELKMRAFAHEHSIDYEEKPHGGALHYRSRPEMAEFVTSQARIFAAVHGWKAQEGKCVVELVKGDVNKGSAVRAFMHTEQFAGAEPIFIGDDLTDEEGFAACKVFGGEGVLVGDRDETCAGYRLPDVASVHGWLGLGSAA